MTAPIRQTVVLFVGLSLVTGLVYPWVVTAMAQLIFPRQSMGSLIERNGEVVGSELIGQSFADDRYFWGRPSATAPMAYNASASNASNLGPLNPALVEAVRARVDAERIATQRPNAIVPIDLVTTSASGLDPEISVDAAFFQVERVARARHQPPEKVRALVDAHIDAPQLGFLGPPRVNVLRLNLALDAEQPHP